MGDDFFEGDGARTPASSTAHFSLNNGAKLTLKPASQIRFQKKAGRKGALKLRVEVGEADDLARGRQLDVGLIGACAYDERRGVVDGAEFVADAQNLCHSAPTHGVPQ